MLATKKRRQGTAPTRRKGTIMAETKQNVVVALFDDEEKGRAAIKAICAEPAGEGYEVPEAVLAAKGEDGISMLEGYEITVEPNGIVTNGTLVGAVVGILGGPLGILLGAGAGAFLARRFISDSRASLITEVARKLYDGDIALIALVSEDEPAFDGVLDGKEATTIIRYDADDIANEVRLANEAQLDMARQSIAAAVAQRNKDISDALQAQFDALKKTVDEALADFDANGDDKAENDDSKKIVIEVVGDDEASDDESENEDEDTSEE